jgi:hypothetical protein
VSEVYLTLDFDGFDSIKMRAKKFKKAYNDLPANLAMHTGEAGQVYLRRLREEAPVRKLPLSNPSQPAPGGLKKGLRVRLEGGGLALVLAPQSDKFYTGIVINGAPAHDIAASKGKHLYFYWANRGVMYYGKQLNGDGHPGTDPNRFDQRAYVRGRNEMRHLILERLRDKVFPA